MEKLQEKSKWEKLYIGREHTINRLQKENDDLRDILRRQTHTNDVVGDRMRAQDSMVQEQINGHNSTMQSLNNRLVELAMEVVRLGGDPDHIGGR